MTSLKTGDRVDGTLDDKTSTRYRVTGTIVDKATGRSASGFRVRAYDKDFFRDQLLGDGTTDDNGRYEIVFGRDDFSGPIVKLERHPDIFVVVFDRDGRQVYSTERSIIVDAGRETSIDLRIPGLVDAGGEPGVTSLVGVAVNVVEAAKLSAQEVLAAYKAMRGVASAEQIRRFQRVFPGIFRRLEAPPECGNGIYEVFRYLMLERNALALLDDADADPYSGATVHQFFTANIVVNYTTDATLPGGGANPNQLPAASAVIPAADSTYTMPNGT